MKAALCKEFGPPDRLVIEDVPSAEPGEGQVAISVKACGINFPDALIIQNKYQFKPPLPFSPGGEIAGVISHVGPGVSGWSVGDAVIAFTTWGGLAEEVVVDASRLLAKPDAMSFVEAAAFTMTYGTSLYALENRGGLRPGEILLVLGAAGGVGAAAVQIGKALGARVIAAASTPDKIEFCRRLGADACIDYTRPDLKDQLKAMTGGKGVDVVLDPVGGAYSEAALRAIAWEGRLMVVGFAAGEIPKIPLNLLLLKGCAILGVFWGEFLRRGGAARDQHLDRLVDLYRTGAVQPQISAVYTLTDAPRAIQDLADRQAKGKIVVTVP